jgi:hypothetical protein
MSDINGFSPNKKGRVKRCLKYFIAAKYFGQRAKRAFVYPRAKFPPLQSRFRDRIFGYAKTMKTFLRCALFFLAALTVINAASAIVSRAANHRAMSKMAMNKVATKPLDKAPNLCKYRSWKLVNPDPIFVPDPVAALCAAPAGPIARSPHDGKFMRIFVNAIGRNAMMKQKTPHFPIGSMIVKEKLPSAKSRKPELLTAMIKRAKGFNPASGDWEYVVLNGSATQIQQHGRLSNCQSCHADQKAADYVFRDDYLPSPIAAKLR